MSHFTVLVVGDDVEAKLKPFDENDRSRFRATTAEEMADLRAKFAANSSGYNSIEKWLEEWHGLEQRDGHWGSVRNPDAKWDWWQVGGRWPDRLVTKAGVACNSTTVGELDLAAVRAAGRRRAEGWWDEAQKREDGRAREALFGIRPETTREQYLGQHENFSSFAVLVNGKWHQRGEMGWWGHVSDEKDMNQWQAEFNKLLESLPPETRITVVDCHI